MTKPTKPTKSTTAAGHSVYAVTAALGKADRLIQIADREFRADRISLNERIDRSIMQQKLDDYVASRHQSLKDAGFDPETSNDPEGYRATLLIETECLARILNKRIADGGEPIDAEWLMDNLLGDSLQEINHLLVVGMTVQEFVAAASAPK